MRHVVQSVERNDGVEQRAGSQLRRETHLRVAEDRRDTAKRNLQVAILNYLNAAGILRVTPGGRLQPLPGMPVGEVIGRR